jgi:hypothetical protein
MLLFHADDLAPATARPRRARLPARIKTLLTGPLQRARPAAQPSATPGGALRASTWPDSFFDADAGS